MRTSSSVAKMRCFAAAAVIVVAAVLGGCGVRHVGAAPNQTAAYWQCLTLYDGGVPIAQYTQMITDQPKYYASSAGPIRFNAVDGKHVWNGAYLLSELRCGE